MSRVCSPVTDGNVREQSFGDGWGTTWSGETKRTQWMKDCTIRNESSCFVSGHDFSRALIQSKKLVADLNLDKSDFQPSRCRVLTPGLKARPFGMNCFSAGLKSSPPADAL
jgi:hypothetical protein